MTEATAKFYYRPALKLQINPSDWFMKNLNLYIIYILFAAKNY